MAPPAALDDATLRTVCEIFAATDRGLTNTEIDRPLGEAGIHDPTPRTAGVGTVVMVSKRDRLHRALAVHQRSDGHGAGVLRFVKLAMRRRATRRLRSSSRIAAMSSTWRSRLTRCAWRRTGASCACAPRRRSRTPAAGLSVSRTP